MNKINLEDGSSIHGKRAKGITNQGWTAFDLAQRRKQQGLQSGDSLEEYPALASTHDKNLPNKHRAQLVKPFSSVVGGSIHSTSLVDSVDIVQKKNLVPGSNSSKDTAVTGVSRRLSNLYPWADKGFIQDVLAAVNDDVDAASCLLEEMLVGGTNHNMDFESDVHDSLKVDVEHMSSKAKEETNSDPYGVRNGGDEANEFLALPKLTLDCFNPLIIEPELDWNENDVYLLHRKDAIKTMRCASRMSKSANEAYLRGDHVAARHFSQKAQEQWNLARRLNAKAANEILSTRNFSNDIWILDLHGLHAAEAIEALQQRLGTVESVHLQDQVASSRLSPIESGIYPLLVEPSHILSKQNPKTLQRPKSLKVITGKGKHSQGPATLPITVKSFLIENGYHFDERPGIIVVRPKFRRR